MSINALGRHACSGSVPGPPQAEEAALTALKDEKEGVRSAAAQALGDMGAKSAKTQLLEALNDKEPSVIIAAGHSLVVLGDEKGYGVFYAILTGRQKTGTSLTDGQKKMLKIPGKWRDWVSGWRWDSCPWADSLWVDTKC